MYRAHIWRETLVQQPHQDRTEHSRSSTPFDHPNWAYLSHAGGHIRTHPESPQRLCTAEVRGSNPLGSTCKSANLRVKRSKGNESFALIRFLVHQ